MAHSARFASDGLDSAVVGPEVAARSALASDQTPSAQSWTTERRSSIPSFVKTIGLTGGIGSGKSTVAEMLEELGATVIHADAIGHQIYEPTTEGWSRIVETFGAAVLRADQTVDRKKLGAVVFADPGALKQLNSIVHPLMFDEICRRIEAYRKAGRSQPIVVEAAILIEANWLPLVNEVWLVVADQAAVTERLARERGLSHTEVAARINAQIDDAERRRFAHVVIENTGSIEDLKKRVRTAWTHAVSAVP